MRLSVIIPVYNTPQTCCDRCLRSVLHDLGLEDEVVCVDDASAADTAFLDDWARRDGRVKVVRLATNSGQAVARNRGMELAQGEWLAFVDSDDEVLPGIYDECLETLARTGADVAVYGVRTVWPDDGLCKEDLPSLSGAGPLSADDVRTMRRECLFNYPWNKVFRRSFLVEKGIRFVGRASPREDEIFNADCVVAGARWCAVRRIGHIYYHGYGSSLGRYRRNEDFANRAVNDAWRRVWRHFGCPDDTTGMTDEDGLKRAEWRNLWRPQSPYSLLARLAWLKENGVKWRHLVFFRMLVFSFLRRWCYIRPLRRWHVRRTYAKVERLKS